MTVPADNPDATALVARLGGLSQLRIDGRWAPARTGETFDVVDPATGTSVGAVAAAMPDDVDAALDAAGRAFPVWRRVDAWTRSATLREVAVRLRANADRLAPITTAESGKPLTEATAEWLAAADQFDWCADEARRIYGRLVDGHQVDQRLLVRREPVGVVAAFTAWNFPALLAARKLAPALAAGCPVIVKPAEETPRSTLALVGIVDEVVLDAGGPRGVAQALTGDPAAIATRLVSSGRVAKVSLTGSVPVGRQLAELAGRHLVAVSLELGGHSPVLVFDDASLDDAVELSVRAKFRNCGQVCISPTRFLVQRAVHDEFVARFAARAAALVVGDGRDPATDVGPLANERRLVAVEELVADAVDRGARVLTGGRRPDGFETGWWYEPTVLAEVAAGSRVLHEEPFGPLAPCAPFDTLDDALAAANDTPYGLAGYVFTGSLTTAFEASEGLEVGMVGVNHLVIATAEAPFGGTKASGFGREGGVEGVEAYTHTKYVNVRLTP